VNNVSFSTHCGHQLPRPLRALPVNARRRIRTLLAVALLAGSAACSTAAPTTKVSVRTRVPVEVWTAGDDGLTQRLADAVRDEFRKSALFNLGLERDNNNLLETGGVCWGDDLGICARQVLDDAAKAVTR
jgi:hypothetical protein